MSLHEARQVTWLRNRPKPLGELLDQGYLNTSRLEWAANKAYDQELREAARVLLEWKTQEGRRSAGFQKSPARDSDLPKPPTLVGISLENARSTPWPFGPLRGQAMGMLSEARQLSLKDLAYAAESAWDDRVRQAAIALLLVRLDQELEEPPPSAGFLRVVAPERSYAERRQLLLALLEGTIGGALFALALGYFVASLLQRRPAAVSKLKITDLLGSPEGILALILVLLLVGVLVWLPNYVLGLINRKLDARIESYRIGQEGEDRVVEKARQALDGDWILFRNVVLPGRRRADLDVVLVGSPGVWAVEVKSLSGKYKNVGEAWEYRAKGQWKRMGKGPSRQALDGALALKDFLKADGIRTYVSAAVAWASQEGGLVIENPTVPVWTMDRVDDELGNLWNGKRLDAPTKDHIVEKLTKLYRPSPNGVW
jgi:hypothetical protein